MKLDLQLERFQIRSGGFAPDPWVLDFRILHEPGDSERFPVSIPTRTGEVVDWTEESRTKKWIGVPDVEKHWIMFAEARPVKPEKRDSMRRNVIETTANLTGQLSSGGLPIRDWLIADLVDLGASAMNFDKFLVDPFASGNIALEDQPESPVRIPLTAPRRVDPGNLNKEKLRGREFTDMETGKTHVPLEELEEIMPGEDQGFVEVSVQEW